MKLSLLFLASVATAVPATSPAKRQVASLCDLYAYWSGNGYEAINNLWGRDSATSGSQCTYVDGTANGGVQWRTTWQWEGAPNNVKSYPYVGKQFAKGRTIASINRMPTTVEWRYDQTTNLRANVAYDIFTAEDPNHVNSSGDYELMIWLARIGDIYPIGQSTGMVTVDGKTWDLWTGYNGDMRVYSFIAPNTMNSLTTDAKLFFDYLEANQGFPVSTQNLIVYQFGTESFTGGPATMTSSWSADVV